MRTVHKYQLPLEDRITVTMPKRATLLCVQTQHEVPALWATVDTAQDLEQVSFIMVGTGHQMPDDAGDHVGSFQLHGGALVFHLFRVIK